MSYYVIEHLGGYVLRVHMREFGWRAHVAKWLLWLAARIGRCQIVMEE